MLTEPITLMERSFAGWSTELRLTPAGQVSILVQQGADGPLQGTIVPLDKALDAFQHPYCYLPR